MIFEVIELLIDLALAFICGSSDGKVDMPSLEIQLLNHFRRNFRKPDLWAEQIKEGANKLALYI